MKKRISFIVFLWMAFVLMACQTEEAIVFSDEKLEEAIRTELNTSEDKLYLEDVQTITDIDLSNQDIRDLSGMETLAAVEIVDLQKNDIDDFSILAELENLMEVNVVGNPALDVEEQQKILEDLSAQGITVVSKPIIEVIGSPDGPGGFLWKVENGETTVYLQGTIHIATEDFYPLHEDIETAYRVADVVVPEIDLTSINPFEIQSMTMELATFQDGTTLKDHISEELYQEVDEFFQMYGLPLGMLETYEPWFLSQMIQQLMMEELEYIHGVDEYFLSRADNDEKEIIPLETAEEQLQIFADTSLEYQIEMLEESLISMEELDAQMSEMFEVYKEGDAEKLLEAVSEEDVEMTEEDIAFMKAINDDRNYGMAEKIAQFLEEDNGDTYFVIVGSAHLLMEPHVLSILEEEGYEVEKVH